MILHFNKYLEFVRTGGKLVVINSNNNFNDTFSRLFSIQANESNTESFSNISGNMNQNVSISASGLVKRLEMKSSPELRILASYRNGNNQTIAPFAIEKIFPNGGRISLSTPKVTLTQSQIHHDNTSYLFQIFQGYWDFPPVKRQTFKVQCNR